MTLNLSALWIDNGLSSSGDLELSAFWIDNDLSSSGDLELVCILNWQWSKFFWWPSTCLHSKLTMVLVLLVTLNLSVFWIDNDLSSSGDLEPVCTNIFNGPWYTLRSVILMSLEARSHWVFLTVTVTVQSDMRQRNGDHYLSVIPLCSHSVCLYFEQCWCW